MAAARCGFVKLHRADRVASVTPPGPERTAGLLWHTLPMAGGQERKEPTLELPALKLPSLKRPGRKRSGQVRARRPRPGATHHGARGRVAAALTGVVVGLTGVGATLAGLAACEAVRGVSTCGGGTGLVLLVAILVVMILLGAVLLRAFGVPDGGATSFLGVGLVAVVSMLVLLEVIDSPWMVLVVPAVAGASYLLAHAVTSRFAGDRGRRDWT